MQTPGAQPATIHPTHSFALLHAAIYDAVVSITEDAPTYLVAVKAPQAARPDAAAATVLTAFFGAHDEVRATSDVLPSAGVRTFSSYQAVATEAGLSRIYAGQHTRLDHDAGLTLGQDIAHFVLRRSQLTYFGVSAGATSSH